jgi:hypothetical protein
MCWQLHLCGDLLLHMQNVQTPENVVHKMVMGETVQKQ